MEIEMRGINKSFGNNAVLNNADLYSVPEKFMH